MPEYRKSVCPRSVSEKSTLTHNGTDAPNIRRSGRKIQLRWLRKRFMKRRKRSTGGISGCLNRRARTYGTSVMPQAQRLIWLYWLVCGAAQSRGGGEAPQNGGGNKIAANNLC